MNDDRLEPDPAALDELLRAFGIEVEPERSAAPPDMDHETPPGRSAPATAPDVERESVSEPERDPTPDPAPEPTPESLVAPPTPEPAPGSLPGAPDAGPAADDVQGPAVITITDEDLPDPVYIAGQLDPERGGSGGTVVFIEDDASGDAFVPTGTERFGRSAMDPKMRDRRVAVRRAEGRRRLRWFVVAGAVLVVVVGALAVLGSPLFSIDVDQVTVTGNVYTDPVALAAVVDDLVGTPTLTADTRAAERALEAIPWVADARVRTRFPSAASIEIRERIPLATYQGADGRFRVIDRDGRVLDVLDGQPVAYMLLTGPDALDLQPGQFTPPGHAAAAELVQALTPTVRGRVASIEVSGDSTDLRMFLDDGMEIRFGAATDLLVKLVRLETVLPIAEDRGMRIIDVSTAEVTVR